MKLNINKQQLNPRASPTVAPIVSDCLNIFLKLIFTELYTSSIAIIKSVRLSLFQINLIDGIY